MNRENAGYHNRSRCLLRLLSGSTGCLNIYAI